jgi:hypothetical protein
LPTPAAHRKQFIKAFESLSHRRERHDVLADFLEMAFCTIRKKTLPAGPDADAIEERYMTVVRRNKVEDVRAMPELLGITAMAIQDGGCDFLGLVAGDLELINGHMGQFFTPYDVSCMIAEMTLDTVDEIIAEQPRRRSTPYSPVWCRRGRVGASVHLRGMPRPARRCSRARPNAAPTLAPSPRLC